MEGDKDAAWVTSLFTGPEICKNRLEVLAGTGESYEDLNCFKKVNQHQILILIMFMIFNSILMEIHTEIFLFCENSSEYLMCGKR